MEREKKVVDASVLFKLYAHEAGSDKAIMLRDAHVDGKILLIVPELIFLEVLNAMRYKGGTTEILSAITKELFDLQLHVERLTDFLLTKAVTVSLEYNLTIYDALYVALAQLYGVEFITADKVLGKVPNVTIIG